MQSKRYRWLLGLLILVVIVVALRWLPVGDFIEAVNAWIAGLGYWGPLAFVFVYILATVLFVPGTLLTLTAGPLFGLWGGTALVSIGSTIGAALAFLIARYVARDRIAKLANENRHFTAIDQAINEGGWRIVGLMRLSPALPFNLQNYLYGLTAIKFWPYVITSWIAMLPGTLMYVYLGYAAGAAVGDVTTGGQGRRSVGEWVMLAVGLAATIAVSVYVARLARRRVG